MKLVLDDQGNAKLEGGHPVYVDEDGVERAFNVAELHSSLKAAADQRDKFQREKKAAEGRLAKYKDGDDYLDPEAARRALALEQNLDGKDVTELQKQLAKVQGERDSLVEQVKEVSGRAESLAAENEDLTIGAAVRGSEWAQQNLIDAYAKHPDRIMREYGGHFKREDGKIIAYRDVNGDSKQPLYSEKNPSEYASVDEALSILVKDKSLLKANNASGGGSDPKTPGGGPPPVNKKWEEMTLAEQAAAVAAEAE